MNVSLPRDWAKILRTQEVPEEDIAEAQALATKLAETADAHPHEPLGSADPAAFLALLRETAP